jgi:outer membrane protein TolC
MTQNEIRAQIAADRAQLPARDQVIEGQVDLDRALVYAVLHNRDLRIKTFEAALSRREVGTTALGMLPELAAEAGYRERDEYDASTSVVLIDGEPDVLPSEPAYSISSGKETRTTDVTFTWNLLDFGLSYVRAKQFADRHLVEAERERKAIQTIAADVRAAYWKAVSAERLLPRIDPLIADAEAALAEARALEDDRAIAPREALERQRNLLDVLRLLQDLKAELSGAKVELAELMGLHPAADFTLADVRAPDLTTPRLDVAIEALEVAALENRPELREAQYQSRIAAREARAAMLKLLPGLRLTGSNSYEDNKYLRTQNWSSFGASINFNLFNIFAINPTADRAEAREALAEERRLATAMTVLAQVHLSAVEFAEEKDGYAMSEEYLDVARRIVEQAEARVDTESAGTQDLIRERLNSLLAEIRRDRAFADVQNSFGRVLDSAGIDLFPTDYRELSPEALTAVVGERFEQIAGGELPVTPPPTQADQAAAEQAAAEQAAAEQAAAEQAAAEQAGCRRAGCRRASCC